MKDSKVGQVHDARISEAGHAEPTAGLAFLRLPNAISVPFLWYVLCSQDSLSLGIRPQICEIPHFWMVCCDRAGGHLH